MTSVDRLFYKCIVKTVPIFVLRNSQTNGSRSREMTYYVYHSRPIVSEPVPRVQSLTGHVVSFASYLMGPPCGAVGGLRDNSH